MQQEGIFLKCILELYIFVIENDFIKNFCRIFSEVS